MILRSGLKLLLPPGVVRKTYTKPLNAPVINLPVIQEMEEPAEQAEQAEQAEPVDDPIVINGDEAPEPQPGAVPNPGHARYHLPSPQKFDGTENVRHWLNDFEAYCTLARIAPGDKAILLYYHLTGLAQSWVRNQPAATRDNYDNLKEALLNKFDTEHLRWKRRHQVHARKQLPTEPVSSYIQNMRELFSNLNQTEEEQIQVFTDNLRDDLRKFVYSKTVHSLDEAEEAATLGETIYPLGKSSVLQKEINQLTELVKSFKPMVQPKSNLATKDLAEVIELVQSLTQERNSRTEDGRPRCFNCNRPGHLARSCKAPRQPMMQGRYCNYCKKQGHNITECRVRRPVNCNLCHRMGHSARNCHLQPQRRPYSGPPVARRNGPLNC